MITVCKLYRYVVVISGRKAVQEALVNNSVDFADRPVLYSQTLVNKHAKGKLKIDCKLLSADWLRICEKDKRDGAAIY